MAPSESGHLKIIDTRTDTEYQVPILDNFINAKDLSKITVQDPEDPDITRKLMILDNGFESTACMTSDITHIDGLRGQVRYRGVPIEQLFRHNDFEDVLHLLLLSHLPTEAEKAATRRAVNAASIPPQSVIDAINAFPVASETYPMIIAGMSAFLAVDKDAAQVRHQAKPIYRENSDLAGQAMFRTLGYYSAVIALVHCHKRGRKFTKPEPTRSIIGNLLLMMGVLDPAGAGPDPDIEATLNKLWILYADHEMTNSTAGSLHVASTLTDPISCAIAGLVCGYGPLHGGAIELAYKGLEKIGSPKNVPIYIEMVKQKKTRLFGYGHRIYKTRDPRLALIEELIEKNKEAVAANPLLRVAFAIDKAANEDEYFISRNLKANADLLGCFLYTALGFERDIIIAIICLSRVVGGLAHWRETLTQPIKLWRPLQIYTGPKYDPVEYAQASGSTSSNDLPVKGLTTSTQEVNPLMRKPRPSLRAKANSLWVKAVAKSIRV